MIVSGNIAHFYHRNGPARGRHDEAGPGIGGNASDEAIPVRYQGEHGGIDIDQIRRDQQAARRKVVHEMLRSVGEILRRR